MLSVSNLRWLCLYFLVGQLNVLSVAAAWPLVNISQVQLLGIFQKQLNTTEPFPQSLHTPAMFKAAIVLSQQYNITINGHFIGWRLVNDGNSVMNTLSSTCLLISNSNITGIVGPTFSREAHVIAPFAAELGIPVISHASTNPELSDRKAYPTFYRTVPSDNEAALAIAKLFIMFNWTSCMIIYQNDAFGSGGANAISEAFNKNNLTVTEMVLFSIMTLTIRGDLKSLLTSSPVRIVILWVDSNYASLILQNALDDDVVGPHFTWILGSNILSNSFDKTWYSKLTGMLIIEPVVGSAVNVPINTTLLNAAYNIWQTYEPETFPGSDNVDDYALFAFDATWSLIQSLNRLCDIGTNRSSSCLSFVNTSFCFDRQFLDSSSLLDLINTNTFLGVSGPVEFSSNQTDRVNGIYYVVKNVQSSSNSLNYVPVLAWSDSGDWNLYTQTSTIIWPGKSLTVPTGYATVSGVTIRIAIIETDPFTMIKEVEDHNGQITKHITGYIPDLIEYLRTKMRFIPNITVLSSNHTYNSLIDEVANNIYDMVIGDVTILSRRREKVGFSSSIFDNSLRVIIRDTSTPAVDFLAYLRPFSFQVWLTILCAVLGSVFFFYLFERQENDALKDRSIISRVGMSMWYSFGTIMGYGVDFHVKTAAGRLLVVGLYILSLVLVAAYTANLTSNLTIAKTQGIISGVDDIKNGRLSFSRIGIVTNSSIEDYYLREISGGSRNFYPLKSREDMYNKLLDKIIDAAVMDAGVLEYATSAVYCNLTLVGAGFDHNSFGIVFPKNWLYEQVLDVSILSLRESGIFDTLKSKWFQSNYCSRSSQTPLELPIEAMAGLFLTYSIIVILSVILYVWLKRFIITDYLSKELKKLSRRQAMEFRH